MDDRTIARLPRFEPGNLITADDLNRIIDALKALDRRLAALEARRPARKPRPLALAIEPVAGHPALSRLASPLACDELERELDPAAREAIVALEHEIGRCGRPPAIFDLDAAAQERPPGCRAMFLGPAGAARTAAVLLARLTGRDLHRVDLPRLAAGFIGETEKNLGAAFAAAKAADAIVFFDEADALFGKRAAVSDAHDRFANIDTNYLLQRLESFDGVAILTASRRRNVDSAFLRRFHAVIEFPA